MYFKKQVNPSPVLTRYAPEGNRSRVRYRAKRFSPSSSSYSHSRRQTRPHLNQPSLPPRHSLRRWRKRKKTAWTHQEERHWKANLKWEIKACCLPRRLKKKKPSKGKHKARMDFQKTHLTGEVLSPQKNPLSKKGREGEELTATCNMHTWSPCIFRISLHPLPDSVNEIPRNIWLHTHQSNEN